MFNSCPSPCCVAGHRHSGHQHVTSPSSVPQTAGEEPGTHSEAPRHARAMAAQPSGGKKPFHIISPVLESLPLSRAAGTKVFMKLENIQPTGSFKIRGIGHLCQEAAKKGCRHFVCSSGGNAGLAAAYAAKKLGLPVTVVVPSTTGPTTVRKLEELGAEVEVSGQVWDEANKRALELAKTEGWVSIHPFDHPLVWQGHASLVQELKDSLDTKPDAILLAVGGGGLLAGVVAGLHQVGWQDIPIIAAETWGTHSFHTALAAGRLVSLPDITSVAKCLGAKMVAARALECAQECQVISQVVEDTEAVRAVEQFLDDERMLVQPACGAALALLYTGRLQRLQHEGWLRTPLASVVVVVCGGSSMQVAQLQALKSQLGLE
ncbi:serine dehydratase-like isoform X2 [Falco cherrug]|uniref:serine dehydratase-like isoform X2 n=1 Tax=Falco cherrug TaxID=345164 RepID=UPI002478AD65|nr:serine dehydratase-like isoform X2 [Falco cherrug]